MLECGNVLQKKMEQAIENKWIRVEERLPEDNTEVLLWCKGRAGQGTAYAVGCVSHGEFWFLKIHSPEYLSFPVLAYNVTHWMPLPEPPKEE